MLESTVGGGPVAENERRMPVWVVVAVPVVLIVGGWLLLISGVLGQALDPG